MKTLKFHPRLSPVFLLFVLMFWNCSSSADLVLQNEEDVQLNLKSGKIGQEKVKADVIEPTYTFNDKWVDLINSSKEIIGTVHLYTESTTGNIFFEIITSGNWAMKGIQLYIGEKKYFPSKGAEKNNPGIFTVYNEFGSLQTTYSYEYLTGSISEYAVVVRTDIELLNLNGESIQSDVAWANENNLRYKGNYYFTYLRIAG